MADMYSDPSSAANNPFLSGSNPYLQDSIDKAQGDVVRNYNLTTQPAYNSAMVRSGSFGNAGVDEMNANGQRTMQDSLGNISTQMRGADYQNRSNLYMQQQGIDNSNYWNNNNFNRSLYNDAYSQNQQNLQTGIGLLGTMAGYNTNDLANGTTIQNTPMNYWSQFANAANGMGQGYGTETKTTGTTSNPFVSAMGGAQLGQSAMGWWNKNFPGTTGTSGNSYAGSSSDPSAANYTNSMDQGFTW
jgi:hypothetical protein